MYTAALFIIAQKGKQPKCPSTDGQIKCDTFRQLNIAHKKGNEMLIHAKKYQYINMEETWKHDAKWKKPVTKDHMVYDSIYTECPQWANPKRQKVD